MMLNKLFADAVLLSVILFTVINKTSAHSVVHVAGTYEVAGPPHHHQAQVDTTEITRRPHASYLVLSGNSANTANEPHYADPSWMDTTTTTIQAEAEELPDIDTAGKPEPSNEFIVYLLCLHIFFIIGLLTGLAFQLAKKWWMKNGTKDVEHGGKEDTLAKLYVDFPRLEPIIRTTHYDVLLKNNYNF